MGGAQGHLLHPHDNLELTFDDLFDLIDDASNARLERTVEKTDGQAVMFSHNGKDVVFARNKSDLLNASVTADEVNERFKGRGNIHTAFSEGARVIEGAINSLSSQQRDKMFFDGDGQRWFSAEIIYHGSRNVIDYDGDHVAFHPNMVYSTRGGKIRPLAAEDPTVLSAVDILMSKIDTMQKAVSNTSWTLHGPLVMSLKKMADGTAATEAKKAIVAVAQSASVPTSTTLQDFIIAREVQAARDLSLDLNHNVVEMIAMRCSDIPGAPNLVAIKRVVNDAQKYEIISSHVKTAPKRIKSYIAPIDVAITRFAANMLRGLTSIMMIDRSRATNVVKNRLISTISELENSSDPKQKEILQAQLSRLTHGIDVDLALEGIVFNWRGKTYKFVGDFSPVNTILGILRYSR